MMQGQGLVMGDDSHQLAAQMGQMVAGGIPGLGAADLSTPPVNGGGAHMMSPGGVVASPGGVVAAPVRTPEDRQLSQWGYHETREFIALRAELEKDYLQTKTNSKTMWEIISAKMKEKGYRRTPAQCKCKWKVLVNRYKGKEIDEGEKQYPPFYEELDAIFKLRAKNMDRLLLESEVGGGLVVGAEGTAGVPTHLKPKPVKISRTKGDDEGTDEEGEEEEGGEEDDGDLALHPTKKRKSAAKRSQTERRHANTIQEVLEQFFLQQLRLEQEWREAIERREVERRQREKEWRDRMESLERERMAREEAWRKAEAERQVREEERAERRDQIIQALIAKLS